LKTKSGHAQNAGCGALLWFENKSSRARQTLNQTFLLQNLVDFFHRRAADALLFAHFREGRQAVAGPEYSGANFAAEVFGESPVFGNFGGLKVIHGKS